MGPKHVAFIFLFRAPFKWRCSALHSWQARQLTSESLTVNWSDNPNLRGGFSVCTISNRPSPFRCHGSHTFAWWWLESFKRWILEENTVSNNLELNCDILGWVFCSGMRNLRREENWIRWINWSWSFCCANQRERERERGWGWGQREWEVRWVCDGEIVYHTPGLGWPLTSSCLGDVFVVQWDKVRIQGREADGPFTFQTALHSNGTIVFGFRDVRPADSN